jgi:tyrosyl-tRNA synthetase
MSSLDEQLHILRRGVDQIVPEDEFRSKLERSLRENRPLRVKYGIDPTGIDVHLGHTVPLRKLRQFQDLGHTAVIIIGNYTALVGDPSGRDETRVALTKEQVETNARDYLKQVGRIIDLDRAEVHHNGDWFSKWSFLDVLDLMRWMTLGQIAAREDFAKRIAAEKPVYLHECLYPLMQGWDSVEIRADVELGGTEQFFSLLVARDLQQSRGQEPQVALTMPILVGTDGVRRMGKSLGNYIGVAESKDNQHGKLMSIPDSAMRQYFTLLTDVPSEEIDQWLLADGNPRDAKEHLAMIIVSQYHPDPVAPPKPIVVVPHGQSRTGFVYRPVVISSNAAAAADEFRRRASGADPVEIPDVMLSADRLDHEGRVAAPLLLKELGLETTTSNARRLIEQGGFNVGPNRQTITDVKALIYVSDGLIVRAGKRKIARIRLV